MSLVEEKDKVKCVSERSRTRKHMMALHHFLVRKKMTRRTHMVFCHPVAFRFIVRENSGMDRISGWPFLPVYVVLHPVKKQEKSC